MRVGWMRTGALAAAVAMLLVSGCSAAPASSQPRSGASSAAAGYWNRSRLVHAQPLSVGQHAAPQAGQVPTAHTAPVALRVGALFEHDASGAHFCTASVVASPGEDLLITAAHCISDGDGSGYKSDIVFIPGYHDGATPYGIWTPRAPARRTTVGGLRGPGLRRRLHRPAAARRRAHPATARRQSARLRHRVPVPGAGHRVPEQRRRPDHLRQLDVHAAVPPSWSSTATVTPAAPAAARG